MKVPLVLEDVRYKYRYTPWVAERRITACLPFVQSRPGCLVHRPRSGAVLLLHGKVTHAVLRTWCGQSVFPNRDGARLMEEPDRRHVLCATCEGRATGAGQMGSHQICGRFVRFKHRGVLSEVPS